MSELLVSCIGGMHVAKQLEVYLLLFILIYCITANIKMSPLLEKAQCAAWFTKNR
jgi:hypothetical protein